MGVQGLDIWWLLTLALGQDLQDLRTNNWSKKLFKEQDPSIAGELFGMFSYRAVFPRTSPAGVSFWDFLEAFVFKGSCLGLLGT